MVIAPVSELKNYNNILEEVKDGNPVYLTKNGKGLYAILTISDVDKYKDNIEFANDVKVNDNVSDMDFFIKDIESLERIIDTNRKKAVQNKFRYKNTEGFDKIRRDLNA